MVSYTHQVAAKGWFIAMVSTTVETNNPEAEIKPALDLLGPIKQKYIVKQDLFFFLDNKNVPIISTGFWQFPISTIPKKTVAIPRFSFPNRTTPPLTSRRPVSTSWTSTVVALEKISISPKSVTTSAMRNSKWMIAIQEC